MRIFKILILVIACMISVPISLNSENKTAISIAQESNNHRPLRLELCKITASHYGNKRDWNEYRIYMYSAYRVSKMFPVYPADSELDRMLLLYELGQHETRWRKDFAVANIPDAKYMGGEMTVRRFSVDYSAWGLNEHNIKWTYDVAKRIQDGKKLPNSIPFEAREMLKMVVIPKDLKLARISLSPAKDAKNEYKELLAKGYKPNNIRKLIKVNGYTESTQDEIDSALIYRLIVELDRKARGWHWGIGSYNRFSDKVDRSLYNKLKEKVKNYEYANAIRGVEWNNTAINPYLEYRGKVEDES